MSGLYIQIGEGQQQGTLIGSELARVLQQPLGFAFSEQRIVFGHDKGVLSAAAHRLETDWKHGRLYSEG